MLGAIAHKSIPADIGIYQAVGLLTMRPKETISFDPTILIPPPLRYKRVSLDSIIDAYCEIIEKPFDWWSRRTRSREVVKYRQIAMYAIRKELGEKKATLKQIGERLGGYDHTTVVHSVQTVEALMVTDPEYKEEVDEILYRIRSRHMA